MRMLASCVTACVLGLGAGCMPRNAMHARLENSTNLVFMEWSPIPDGGSMVFTFRNEKGEHIGFLVKHCNRAIGGNARYQEIRVDDSEAYEPYYELKAGSSLEGHALRLLRTAKVSVATDVDEMARPTSEGLSWLISKISDRRPNWKGNP